MTAPRWLPCGIGGLKRSGKGSLARAVATELRRRRGSDFACIGVAFAEALRDVVTAAYGLHSDDMGRRYEELKEVVHPDWGITRRQMLINFGVPAIIPGGNFDHYAIRWGLEVEHELVELRYAARERGRHSGEAARDVFVLADDVRRLNEAATVLDRGGVNVLVRAKRAPWNGHVTEALAHVAGLAEDEGRPLVFGDDRLVEFVERMREERGREAWLDFSSLLKGTWQQHDGRRVFDRVVYNDGAEADLAVHAVGIADELMRRMP